MTDRDRAIRLTRRRLLTGAAAATGLALLAACGGAEPTATSAPASTGGGGAGAAPGRLKPATIRLALFGSEEAAANARKLYESFKQIQPDITVQITPYQAPDWDGFFQKLLTEIAAGQTPDMVSVATEGAHLCAGKKLAAPIDDYVKRDKEQLRDYFQDTSPALIEAMMYDGRLYCLPDNFNAANLYYSKTAFEKKGVPLPTGWTKDDFYNNLPKLATQSGGRTSEFGYFWTNRMWGGALPWIFLNGGNVLNEERFPGGEWLWNEFYKDNPAAQGRGGGYRWNKATANTPENVEALQLLVDMTHKQKAAPTPAEADSSNSQINALFAAGQLAMFASGGFLIRNLKTGGVDMNTISATFMPKWKTQRHQFGTADLFIMEKSQNKDAAWELAKWRISKEAMTAQFPFGASVPARRSLSKPLYEDTYGFKDWQVFYDTFDKFPDTAPIPQPPQANQVTAAFTKYVGLALTQDLAPQAALDQMQRDLTDALSRPA